MFQSVRFLPRLFLLGLAVLLLGTAVGRAEEFPPDAVFKQIAANRDAYGRVVFIFGDSVVMLCSLTEVDFSAIKENSNDQAYMVSAMADLMRDKEKAKGKGTDPLWPMHSLASSMNFQFAAAGLLDTPDGGDTVPAARVVAAYAGALGQPFPKDVEARADQLAGLAKDGVIRDGDVVILEDAGFHGQDPDAYEANWLRLGRSILENVGATVIMCDMFDAIPDGSIMGVPAEAFRFEALFPSNVPEGKRSHNQALRAAAAKLAALPDSKGKVVLLDLRPRMNAFKAALTAELGGEAIMPEGIHPSPWGVAFMGREYLRAAGLAPQLTNPAPYVDRLAANAGRLSQPCRPAPADKARPFIEAWIVP
ncbi:MAG: hypothetical protein B193_2121 [Solidesulfovibrio magneticus str. Maddingley MBC34]|uniref:Uncharacterized protein n=1 Tax=Solidesulfovibrio magneticus str. Maddingley MBC34 TaxID=1206767 RepID=K6GQB3_9BACT|nr:MAG: hypothetical protein B193_2121 [Solidesulfovibrio magneticus str. Maddingley MBC34]